MTIRPLPPEILACVKAAGLSYTHIEDDTPDMTEVDSRFTCRLREDLAIHRGERNSICTCQPGKCLKFGTIHNPVKVPGHPDHPGYLRAFPNREV